MAVIVSERVMARQLLHPFFTTRNREVVVAETRPGRSTELQEAQQDPTQTGPAWDQQRQTDSNGDDVSATDIDEDPNQERRKRRCTISPVEQMSVELRRSRHEQSESVAATDLTATDLTASHDKPEMIIANQSQPSTKPEQEAAMPQLDGSFDLRDPSKSRTPTKSRILKLRADGKLKSPTSTDISEESEPKKRRKRRVGGKRDKHLVLRYGRTPHERLSVGRKIEQINGGKLRVRELPDTGAMSGIDEVNKKRHESEEKINSQNGPTHPFFLGRPKQQEPKHSGLVKSSNDQEDGSTPSGEKRTDGVAKSKSSSWPTAFGTSFSKPPKIPGSLQAIWPPVDMQHVRGFQFTQESGEPTFSRFPTTSTYRSKGKERLVPTVEEVFKLQENLVNSHRKKLMIDDNHTQSRPDVYSPVRHNLTGHDLQIRLSENLSALSRDRNNLDQPSTDGASPGQSVISEAAQNLFQKVATSFSAFDSFDCEAQDWCHKYAPRTVGHVLQTQPELCLLRNWIHAMNVDSVNVKLSTGSDKMNAKRQLAEKRRKRKIKGELDDFIASSDEEAGETAEAIGSEAETHMDPNDSTDTRGCSLKKLKPGNLHKTRAVLISGAHGCGKTASVYAIASELGFEVFEINSGTRRNGKDIMDRVGDMTKNHLVRHDKQSGAADEIRINGEAEDLDEKQQSVTSFFKSKAKDMGQKEKHNTKTAEKSQTPKARKQQKQSLILLEEVDVLFEEDRPFWSAVFVLIVQSRRPIIMTCSDERGLPLEEFVDTSILRLTPQAPEVITEYLMCLAANEGHLLSSVAVKNLVTLRDGDLRGALSDLQFWCQMAVGDTKHGITWFMEASNANKHRTGSQGKLRIVSEATLREDCFLLERKQGRYRDLAYGSRLIHEVYDMTGLDFAEMGCDQTHLTHGNRSRHENLRDLAMLDLAYDARSASDIWPFAPSVIEQLDATQPELSPAQRLDFVDDHTLLQADRLEQPSDLGSNIAFTMRASCHGMLASPEHPDGSMRRKAFISAVLEKKRNKPVKASRIQHQMRQAFEDLAEPQDGTPWNPSRGPGISVFCGPSSTISAEVAPVVREIALYDLELEEERHRLSSLMNVPGRQGKRQRKTRASRAALEGGSKASTRRERWWADGIDYRDILRTAGNGWTQLALHSYESSKLQISETETRESSMIPSSSPRPSAEPADSADELA